MPHHPNDRHLRAFTIVELLTVIAIVGILGAILIPTVSKMRASARTATCLSNMRQIGSAFALYAQEHEGRLPAAGDSATNPNGYFWMISIHPYTGSTIPPDQFFNPDWTKVNPIFVCPEWPNVRGALTPENLGYAMATPRRRDSNGVDLGQDTSKQVALYEIPYPSRTLLVVEENSIYFNAEQIDGGTYLKGVEDAAQRSLRHESKANYLFVDGHVAGLSREAAAAYFPSSK